MAELPPDLQARISALASDRSSGASAILQAAIGILKEALTLGTVRPAALGLCRAQPTMAPVWNAALHALAARGEVDRFERFAGGVARAPQALARFGRTLFDMDPPPSAFRVVTVSASSSVTVLLEALHRRGPLTVACSEGRPALEGRQLAARLAALGAHVTFFTDAALANALDAADVVLVGADAVGPRDFVNKTGTGMLLAAAGVRGVPVYVAATRDKFVMPALWPRLDVREESPDEVWSTPPPGVSVRNPYFERVPLDLVTGVISDLGVLGYDMVLEVCVSLESPELLAALDELVGSP